MVKLTALHLPFTVFTGVHSHEQEFGTNTEY
jgi:hypothetical protein